MYFPQYTLWNCENGCLKILIIIILPFIGKNILSVMLDIDTKLINKLILNRLCTNSLSHF